MAAGVGCVCVYVCARVDYNIHLDQVLMILSEYFSNRQGDMHLSIKLMKYLLKNLF